MLTDLQRRHLETERRFYKSMNKKRSFFLSFVIVLAGFLVLYYSLLRFDSGNIINSWLLFLFVGSLLVVETMIAYYLFEYHRRKYAGN
jgi:hypothetical protein